MKKLAIVVFAVVAFGLTAADAEAGCRRPVRNALRGAWHVATTPVRVVRHVRQNHRRRRCVVVVRCGTAPRAIRTAPGPANLPAAPTQEP